MLSFHEFLLEVPRDSHRAAKLGANLARRHTKKYGRLYGWDQTIRFKGYDVATNAKVVDSVYRKKKIGDGQPVTVQVSRLLPTQLGTSFDYDYARSCKFRDLEPLQVYVHDHNNRMYIINGHHRWIAAKLQGRKTVEAILYRAVRTPIVHGNRRPQMDVPSMSFG